MFQDVLEFLGDGGDLFDTVLVGGQVALEGLVLLLERLELGQPARTEVLQTPKASQDARANGNSRANSAAWVVTILEGLFSFAVFFGKVNNSK